MDKARLKGKFRRASSCAENSCGEVAIDGDTGTVGFRNSADPDTVVLLSTDEWRVVREGILAGDFAV